MRLLWLNLSCVLVCIISYVGVKAGGFDNVPIEGGFTRDNYKREITKLIQIELNQSLKYLYTGVGYANQMVHKPGMAKFLRSLSDEKWDEGVEAIRKYVQRGGNPSDIFTHNHFNFEGTNQLVMTQESTIDIRPEYQRTLQVLQKDSEQTSFVLNKIHEMTQKAKDGQHDADWSHFAEDRLDKEVKRTHAMIGHITTMNQMYKSPMAFEIFDSHLA